MTITIDLPPDVASSLARKAAQSGQDMTEYLQGVAAHAAGITAATVSRRPARPRCR